MNISQNPLVSVVLAVHRKSAYFSQALESLRIQTLQEIEIIIVANNCSNEYFQELSEYIDSLHDQRIIIYRIQLGQHASSINYGMMMAKSNYVARMDYDDICLPERLKKQYEFLIKHPNVGVVGSSYARINEKGEVFKTVHARTSSKEIRRILPFSNPFCHPSVMLRKDMIFKISGYSGGLFSEDYSLWLRASRDKNFELRNLDEILLHYRITNFQSRGMRLAYAEVAGLLFTEALLRRSLIYFIGSIFSSFKILCAFK